MPLNNNMAKWNIPDRDAAALLSHVPTPGEMQWKCPASQTCHCCAVGKRAEQSSSHPPPAAAAAIAVSLCCTGLKHDIPPSASPQVCQHTSKRILYIRTALNTPDSCGIDVSHSENLRNVFASSAIRGDHWWYMANFGLIWHVAAHPYKKPQHTLARHTGQRRRKHGFYISWADQAHITYYFFYLFLWGDNI